MPLSIFMRVDLPAPLWPTTACTVPRSKDRSTPASACAPPNAFEISFTWSNKLSDAGTTTPSDLSRTLATFRHSLPWWIALFSRLARGMECHFSSIPPSYSHHVIVLLERWLFAVPVVRPGFRDVFACRRGADGFHQQWHFLAEQYLAHDGRVGMTRLRDG